MITGAIDGGVEVTDAQDRAQIRDLIESVEGDEWDHSPDGAARLLFPYHTDVAKDLGITASSAFQGDMNAAKELHEALLHEADWANMSYSKRYSEEAKAEITTSTGTWQSVSTNPARAWLLAILRAYEARR